ncbi:formin-like protein 3 [Nothoprocta perdicaria]|uniref:formin-like protein 3 n=1 Tax=Nothoprocta perdicaria TaxID=30464 RepID=UPI000E1C2F0F|nr:formin-like protein 3 [Nothoprocta perdicaria]
MGNVESADGEALPRGSPAAAPAGPGLLAPGKMPMPEPCELEERFALVLSSMNLPPDKARLLRQYDNEKKWDLICDQERFQVKSPPHAYIQKLQSFLDPSVTRKKFRRRVQESTKVLRELEISLRTNHIGWVREFLNADNRGLDVLVNYLSFAQCAVTFDFEGPDGAEDGGLEKPRAWSRSIEDLQPPGTLPAPLASSLARAARHGALRSGTLPSRKALKNARLVSQKDDVHLCIMCLRAIMNYQVCKEKHRFERLMDYFRNEDSSIDFMVACMQFINIVVHSVEDMNFRVHLQYEFTKLGLEEFLQKSRHTESEKLQVQIQAYLDNVFDVGGLLEDAETKNVALEKVEELEEHLSHLTEKLLDLENENMMRVAELEKQLLQREKELELVKETYEHTSRQVHTLRRVIEEKDAAFRQRKCPPAPPLPGASPSIALTVGLSAIRIKKPIKTKFRLPVFNWTALKPNQISGTVFSELDDERVLEDLDLERFEELFKTKAQGPALDLVCAKSKAAHKAASKVTLLEANRAKNLAITLRKAGRSAEEICRAIHTFDLATLPVDFVECLMRFVPTEAEAKALRQYERERKPLEELAAEDRFMLHFCKVERLPQRMAIMAFLGNFAENVQMLTPQLNAIIAASASVKSSQKLKHMLEIILALGNYMNSSKRGAVYGFKLQSLDLLLDTKSTDRKLTLLHFIALTVREKYPELATFWQELHFVEKAAAVSLENVLLDVKELGRGMELLRRECALHEHGVLRAFLAASEGKLERLQKDARTAEDAYNTVVRYFGESPKTTPPSVFFPVFVRFIRSYKDAEQENETRKKQEEVMREKMLAQEAKKMEKRNKWQQQELIAELRRRQAKDHRPVYEGKDGTIEDIITALKSVPFTARTAKRGSRFFCDPAHHDESNC